MNEDSVIMNNDEGLKGETKKIENSWKRFTCMASCGCLGYLELTKITLASNNLFLFSILSICLI